MKKFDVDIDVQSNSNKETYGDREELQPHPSGVYIDSNIPVDNETGLSAIEYERAEELGYIKIDLLTNTSYSVFNTKQEVLDAGIKEPNWELLNDERFVKTLPHIADHFEIISLLEPKSIEDLADALSLIRPGKKHLIENYINDKISTRENLYRKPLDKKYYFKKSHAISYAMMIVCVMNSKDNKKMIIF